MTEIDLNKLIKDMCSLNKEKFKLLVQSKKYDKVLMKMRIYNLQPLEAAEAAEKDLEIDLNDKFFLEHLFYEALKDAGCDNTYIAQAMEDYKFQMNIEFKRFYNASERDPDMFGRMFPKMFTPVHDYLVNMSIKRYDKRLKENK